MRLGVDAWLKRWSDCDMAFRVLIRKCETNTEIKERETESLELEGNEGRVVCVCQCLWVANLKEREKRRGGDCEVLEVGTSNMSPSYEEED